ncbi:MAG: hypothetical protein LBL74_06725 [Bacteroidales bacterium]|nr:hypothetical protein [Bacteroidales bacterium]
MFSVKTSYVSGQNIVCFGQKHRMFHPTKSNPARTKSNYRRTKSNPA